MRPHAVFGRGHVQHARKRVVSTGRTRARGLPSACPDGRMMTDRLVASAPEATQVLPARLEPDAIGAAQDTIIGMANSAPTVAIGLSLAGLAAAAAYGSGAVIILCGIPMLGVAKRSWR